jgi:hypothetical protein
MTSALALFFASFFLTCRLPPNAKADLSDYCWADYYRELG